MGDMVIEIVGATVLCGLGVVLLFCGLWAIIHIVADSIFYVLNVYDKIKRYRGRK